MMDEIPGLQSTTKVDLLAERYRAAFDKTVRIQKQSEAVRAEWIEATLELAAVVLEARNRFPDHHAFHRWHERNGLRTLTEGERAALLGFARDPVTARKLLTESTSYKVRTIWENVPKGMQRTPSGTEGGTPAPLSRRTGHAHRQRRQRIPDVMQERPVRPIVHLKPLTREQVDPDFEGNSVQFATKYGHVNLHTKAEIEHNKHQDVLQKWLGIVANAARAAEAVSGLPDPETMIDWLQKPGKRARFDGWIYTLETVVARLKACLPPKTLAEVEAELDAIGEPPN